MVRRGSGAKERKVSVTVEARDGKLFEIRTSLRSNPSVNFVF